MQKISSLDECVYLKSSNRIWKGIISHKGMVKDGIRVWLIIDALPEHQTEKPMQLMLKDNHAEK